MLICYLESGAGLYYTSRGEGMATARGLTESGVLPKVSRVKYFYSARNIDEILTMICKISSLGGKFIAYISINKYEPEGYRVKYWDISVEKNYFRLEVL